MDVLKPKVTIISTMHVADIEGYNWTAITGVCNDERFMCVVGMQTDDRDMEFMHVCGENMSYDQEGEKWDALLVAMSGRHGW